MAGAARPSCWGGAARPCRGSEPGGGVVGGGQRAGGRGAAPGCRAAGPGAGAAVRPAGSRWTHPAVAAWRNGSLDGTGIGHDVLRPEGADEVDVDSLRRSLEDSVRGHVPFDAGHPAIYSRDSSNYRQIPTGVVITATT